MSNDYYYYYYSSRAGFCPLIRVTVICIYKEIYIFLPRARLLMKLVKITSNQMKSYNPSNPDILFPITANFLCTFANVHPWHV